MRPYFIDWIESLDIWKFIPLFWIVLIFIPISWIILIRLRIMFWKSLLVSVFCILLLFQPRHIWILALVVLGVLLFLIRFPLEQMFFSFLIWIYEKIKGKKTFVNIQEDLQGTRIRRDHMVTRMVVDQSERIYFNQEFFMKFIFPEIKCYFSKILFRKEKKEFQQREDEK